ncbi:hypothetical protein BSK49_10785 [Paenibacillus odorifer]|jgi:glycosyltransferase involved in cell wall biosynthesis|uniref:glycosyltransferase family 2 protein n=1 Tax=Paenibacillus TaxID=44249 RepID=UPI00096D1D66|nr:glycosyltransferase family A protein [Paenibacillus odorifer]OMD89844.1 hypothetical protein BSK49_10785 [Paenibacillus odorifer]OMD95832.1 hypothetical protein BSK64_29480 [Paenibacillus odorifer]
MTISLIITAHHSRYLIEALLSISTQTTKKFDLICIADIHSDEQSYHTFQEISPYIKCNDIKIVKIIGNGTAGYTRNIGFEMAKTKWVTYLDGDDLLHPDALRIVCDFINDPENSDISIFSSGMIRIMGDGALNPWKDSLTYLPPINIYKIDPETIDEPTYMNQLQVVRKDCWKKYKYNETANGEDIDFLLHHLLIGKFKKIPHYLYYFRDTPNSFSKKEFENSDICTQRYDNGYYLDLFNNNFQESFRINFR